MAKQTDLETVTRLLKDPTIVRLVTVLDIASLSILELLEYGLTRKDVNHVLTNEVIEIDKKSETPVQPVPTRNASSLLTDTESLLLYWLITSRVTVLSALLCDL